MGFPLYVTCCFSLAAFNIHSLCLVFVSLISMCLGMFLLGFILYGTLCVSWTWLTISFSGEIFNYNLFKIFLIPFLFLFFFWDPSIRMLVHLIFLQRSLRLSSVLFILLLYSVQNKLFLPFYLPAHCFILLVQIFCYWFLLEYF